VSLVSEIDVLSENYAVEASKHGKMENYEFGREKPAESTETIHKTIRHDTTTDSIERTKENNQKLVASEGAFKLACNLPVGISYRPT